MHPKSELQHIWQPHTQIPLSLWSLAIKGQTSSQGVRKMAGRFAEVHASAGLLPITVITVCLPGAHPIYLCGFRGHC